jgi:DNA-directed RNA polymerase subunit alpha
VLYEIQLPELHPIKEDGNKATFAIEPLYSGYGMTLGNSLRRVILSSLGGAAVTAVKIDTVSHEFSAIDGVKEDVVEILLNLKKLRFRVFSDEPQFIMLTKTGKGEVKASDIKTNADVEIVNPDQLIATLDNAKSKIGMEIKVEKGRGYVPVEAREAEKLEVGMIAVDALYSPVQRVRYSVPTLTSWFSRSRPMVPSAQLTPSNKLPRFWSNTSPSSLVTHSQPPLPSPLMTVLTLVLPRLWSRSLTSPHVQLTP